MNTQKCKRGQWKFWSGTTTAWNKAYFPCIFCTTVLLAASVMTSSIVTSSILRQGLKNPRVTEIRILNLKFDLNPLKFDLIASFQQYMRTLQLKGYLTWSIALDIITQDSALAMIPVQKFVTNTDQQREMMAGEDNYNAIISKSFVGFRSVIFQSYIRVPHQMFHVSTQAFQEWVKNCFRKIDQSYKFCLNPVLYSTLRRLGATLHSASGRRNIFAQIETIRDVFESKSRRWGAS